MSVAPHVSEKVAWQAAGGEELLPEEAVNWPLGPHWNGPALREKP